MNSPYFFKTRFSALYYHCNVARLAVLFTFFAVWYSPAMLFTQTPAYLHFDIRDGLPSNLIYCAYQDKKGIMWFGTNNGLASYDGLRFHVYGTKDGLPDPEVLGLWEDSKERLWVANFRQKLCYRKDGIFFTGENDSLLAKLKEYNTIFTFQEDKDGCLYFAGLHPRALITDNITFNQLEFPSSIAYFGNIDGSIYGLGTSAIFRVNDNKQGYKKIKEFVTPSGPKHYFGVAVSGNRILYSIYNKLILIELNNDRVELIVKVNTQMSGQVFSDKQGRFWLCSQIGGAICFNNTLRDLSNPTLFLQNKKIMAMNQDMQGTFWFCTQDEGIYALTMRETIKYTELDGLKSENVTSILYEKDQNVWIGCNNGDVFCVNKNMNMKKIDFEITNNQGRCRQILGGFENKIWIVNDDCLLVYDKKNSSTKDILPSLSAFKYIAMQSDKIWYICFSHLGYILNDESYKNYRYHHRRFTAIVIDFNNSLWVGRNDGLFFGPDSLAYNWGDRFPELKSRIVSIQAADPNHLWVVTPTSGLLWVQINKGTVQDVVVMNQKLKKPIENIQSVFREPNGRLWMATNHGIYGLNTDWSVMHIDHTYGLAADDVNAVAVQGDTLWAGTVAGLSRIVLSSLRGTSEYPTLIAGLRYTQNEIVYNFHLLDSLTSRRFTSLPANANLVEFDLAGLDFTSRGNINFEYVIRSELPPWYYWTPQNIAEWIKNGFAVKEDTIFLEKGTLSFGVEMPPGQYYLKIYAISGMGVRSNYPTDWTILMAPHWYETVWLALSIVGMIGYGLYKYRKNQVFVEEADTQILKLKLLTLQSQIDPHYIGNTVNAIQKFFYPFDLIKASLYVSSFTRMLRQSMRFAKSSFIPFKDELNFINDYLAISKLSARHELNYEFEGVDLIPEDYPFPVMILQPFIENAVLHGEAESGPSLITVKFEPYSYETIKCTIIDNGLGIRKKSLEKRQQPNKNNSRGLGIISEKIKVINTLYGADLACSITDQSDDIPPTHGTRIEITFRRPNMERMN